MVKGQFWVVLFGRKCWLILIVGMVEKPKKQSSSNIDFVTIDTIYKIGRFCNDRIFPPKVPFQKKLPHL